MGKVRNGQLDPTLALLTGRTGGQTFYGSDTTGEAVSVRGNSVEDKGIDVDGDGNAAIDGDLDVGSGTNGVVDAKDSSDVSQAKLNPVGDGYHMQNFGQGTKTPNTMSDIVGGHTTSSRSITSATGTLAVTDYVVNMNYLATGAVAFLLLTAQAIDGRTIVLVDSVNNSATSNLTVNTEGAETVEFAASVVLATNGGSLVLRYDAANTNWKLI